MKKLEISREEAIDIIESDKAIDKGKKLFELTDEQKKAEKKARITTGKSKVDAYGKKSERKKQVNTDKIDLIGVVGKSLEEFGAENFNYLNKEREIEFTYKNIKYKIVMSVPRK